MNRLNEITDLLRDYSGVENINPDSDIFDDISLDGDDFHEFIDEYSQVYNVDMTTYIWYFHTNEEGQNLGRLFFKSPYERVTRIPITPKLLADFVQTKKWGIQYPEHSLPKRRYDILVNQVILIVLVLVIVYWMFKTKT